MLGDMFWEGRVYGGWDVSFRWCSRLPPQDSVVFTIPWVILYRGHFLNPDPHFLGVGLHCRQYLEDISGGTQYSNTHTTCFRIVKFWSSVIYFHLVVNRDGPEMANKLKFATNVGQFMFCKAVCQLKNCHKLPSILMQFVTVHEEQKARFKPLFSS